MLPKIISMNLKDRDQVNFNIYADRMDMEYVLSYPEFRG